MKIKIMVVQPCVKAGRIDENIENVENLLAKTKASACDLIVLPELWTCGWDCANFNNYSEPVETSKTLKFLKKIAVKYNSNIIGGSSILRKEGQKDRNTCVILDRNAKIIALYDKYHLFSQRGEAEGNFLEEGENALIVNTDIGKIGISICYDIRFPEMFRLYKNTDMIVNMAAWPKGFIDEYVALAKARAIENQLYFICASLTGKINDLYSFGGDSMVVDFHGKIISSLKEEEKVLQAEIDTDIMKQYREQMPVLNDIKENYQILEI